MEELGREYCETVRHYACDCCGRWLPKGTFNVLTAYYKEADMLPELGRVMVFTWHCLECEEVGA
jgi:hypothetical protein